MRQLIKNAIIIDGSGDSAFAGQLIIENDRISDVIHDPSILINDVDSIIDANQANVCPGFIDVHSHGDLAPFVNDGFKPKTTQGVTTECVGLCGLGVSPIPIKLQAQLRQRLIIGNPDINWHWHDIASYLEASQQQGLAVNFAMFLPHGLLRFQLCGDNNSPMDNAQLHVLEALAHQGLNDGALGISLGLIYHPAIFSDKNELKVLAKVAAIHNKPLVVHMRSESDEIIQALQELINITAGYHCQLHISHLKVIGHRNTHKLPQLLQIITNNGLSFDQYPYHYGSTTLLSILPPAIIRHYSGDNLFEALKKETIRQQIKHWFSEKIIPVAGEPWDNLPALVGWHNIIICETNTPEAHQWIGKSILKCANESQLSAEDFVLNLLIEQKGLVRMIDYFMDEHMVETILQHPNGMVATDTILGGQLHPRVSGTFPRIINHYVKQRKILTLEQAIRKMTSLSAETFKLTKRGKIAPGYVADICVFNDDFKDNATIDHANALSTGLQYLWINGQLKIANGEYLQTQSGHVIR